MYLWNPFAILSSVAGTSSSLENLLILVGVLGGVEGNVPLASFGVAAGAYVGLHPLLLMVSGLRGLVQQGHMQSRGREDEKSRGSASYVCVRCSR